MDSGDQTFDPFDLDSPMDLDAPPPRSRPVRFAPKLKGKVKSEPNENQVPVPLQEKEKLMIVSGSTSSCSSSLSIPAPMEEDDPVVREIDVFCTHLEEDAQLYNMQYPLRPSWRPYELEKRCEQVKVQPKKSEFEIVLLIDVSSENYNTNVPEPMRLQKQTLVASKATSIIDCAAGILIGNQLHLNPIHEVLQFRPSMKHIDDCVAPIKSGQEVCNKSDKGKSVTGDLRDLTGYAEPWVSMEYNSIGSTISCQYQQKMMAPREYHIGFTSKPSEYMNSLCPQTFTRKAKVPISRFLCSLPLEERLKEWFLKGCQVNRFDALTHLDPSKSREDFLKMLECHAFMVQGLWVAKSSLIYEGHEAQLRDYILFRFHENNVIKKAKLEELKINYKALSNLLRPLAYERTSLKDWKFREERDVSFIKGHLHIVKEQELAWSARGKLLREYISKMGATLPSMGKKPPFVNMASKKIAAHKVDSGSIRVNDGSGSLIAPSMSNENQESLKRALLQVFRDRKAQSITSIRQALRDLALSKSSRPKEDSKTNALVRAIAIAAAGSSPDFLSVLKEVAVEVHNIYILRFGEHPALDPLRDVVLRLFANKGPNAKLKKQEIVEAVKATLKRDVSASEYKQVVNELCVHNKGAWVLKGADSKE